MAIALVPAQLPRLCDYLVRGLPRSFKIYGELKNHLRGTWPGISYWVDSWPDPRVVLSKPEAGKTKTSYIENIYSVYCTDKDALSQLLREPGLVNWSQDPMFAAVEKDYCDVIEALGKEHGNSVSRNDCIVYTATESSLKKVEVPADMTLTSLGEEHVAAIVSQWKYASVGVESFVQALVSTFPSCCLLDHSGKLVGSVLGQPYDVAGMLLVDPAHRGRGLASLLMTALAREYPQPPLSITDLDNLPAQRLHEKIGYSRIPDFVITWMKCTKAP